MKPTFQRIAYDGIQVANPTNLATILAMIDRVGLHSGGTALDIGAGTGAVSVAMARALGLTVHAVERDVELAEAIRSRALAENVQDQVHVHAETSHAVLASIPPVDLMVALGTTQPAGPAGTDPTTTFRRLAERLRDPGYLLWGDLFWKGDPPAPLRAVIDLTGERASQVGWRAAGEAAGLQCVATEVGSDADWDAYFSGSDARVRAWLETHPDAPEADGIRARADQIKTTFEFGRPWLGFGLYLFRASASPLPA